MQQLVYENYNKFLTATCTVKKMQNDFMEMGQVSRVLVCKYFQFLIFIVLKSSIIWNVLVGILKVFFFTACKESVSVHFEIFFSCSFLCFSSN